MPSSLTIACIGSRATPPVMLDWMRQAGARLVRAGHRIVTGNAPGADQAWAAGGNSVDPTKVTLCLPWDGFEPRKVHVQNGVSILGPVRTHKRYYDEAAAHHVMWHNLTVGEQRLHARNVMIVERANVVLGWTDGATGGTRATFGLARERGVPVSVVHADTEVLALVKKLVRR